MVVQMPLHVPITLVVGLARGSKSEREGHCVREKERMFLREREVREHKERHVSRKRRRHHLHDFVKLIGLERQTGSSVKPDHAGIRQAKDGTGSWDRAGLE